MVAPAPPPMPVNSAVALSRPVSRITLNSIQTKAAKLPDRIGIYAGPGWGKTSLAAQFKNNLFIMSKGETGLNTLIQSKQLPNVAHFPELQTWEEYLDALNIVRSEDHPYKVLSIDTFNGIQRMCAKYRCDLDYKGNWGKDKAGFESWGGQGWRSAITDWQDMLSVLDKIREERQMLIVILMHARSRKINNPRGNDYDRVEPDMHENIWAATERWLDIILYGDTLISVTDDGKGVGGKTRVVYTEGEAAFTAKHRHGLSGMFRVPETPQGVYQSLIAEMKAGALRGKASLGADTIETTVTNSTLEPFPEPTTQFPPAGNTTSPNDDPDAALGPDHELPEEEED